MIVTKTVTYPRVLILYSHKNMECDADKNLIVVSEFFSCSYDIPHGMSPPNIYYQKI